MRAGESARFSSHTSGSNPLTTARCVVFAYHEVGYACINELLALGAPIAALFTHLDSTAEEIWWRSCGELACQNDIPVFTTESWAAMLMRDHCNAPVKSKASCCWFGANRIRTFRLTAGQELERR